MKVQMFESKSPFKGQQIKLGLAAYWDLPRFCWEAVPRTWG